MSEIETETKERVVKTPETEEERAARIAKQEEVDSRSIYVGNVDYQSTPEQLEELFREVGVIERVTILFDKYSGLPKGYAYIEFETVDAVTKAIEQLHGKTFRGREIRVTAKRTNLPGFKRRGGFRGGRGRGSVRGRGGARGRGASRGRGGRGRGGKGDGEVEGETAAAAAAAEPTESVPAAKPETTE